MSMAVSEMCKGEGYGGILRDVEGRKRAEVE